MYREREREWERKREKEMYIGRNVWREKEREIKICANERGWYGEDRKKDNCQKKERERERERETDRQTDRQTEMCKLGKLIQRGQSKRQ